MSTKTITLALSAVLLCAGALQAGVANAGATTRPAGVATSRPAPVTQIARNGADNTAADKGEARGKAADGPRHSRATETAPTEVARHGADDGANHEAGEHAGGDDHGGRHGGRG